MGGGALTFFWTPVPYHINFFFEISDPVPYHFILIRGTDLLAKNPVPYHLIFFFEISDPVPYAIDYFFRAHPPPFVSGTVLMKNSILGNVKDVDGIFLSLALLGPTMCHEPIAHRYWRRVTPI